MRQQGVERIRDENEERRNMRQKDMPEREQRNIRLNDKWQRELQVTARKEVFEGVKNEVKIKELCR